MHTFFPESPRHMHAHTAVNPKVVEPKLWHYTHLRYTLWGIAAARYDVILEAFQPHLLCSCHKQAFCHHASPARHWGLLMIWKSKGLPQCCECKAPRQSSSMRDKREEKSHLSLGLSAARIWCRGLGTGPCYVKRSEDVLTLPKQKEKGTARERERVLPFWTSFPKWQPCWMRGPDLASMMMSTRLLFPGYFIRLIHHFKSAQ